MPVAQTSKSIMFPGYTFSETLAPVSAEYAPNWAIDLPANPSTNTGTLTTRTYDDTGVATLNASHTIVTSGALVDVYWATGARYGMDATKDGATVTLDGGAGDALPLQDTAVTVCTQTKIDVLPIDGDQLEWLAIVYSNPSDTDAKASLDMHDSGGSEYQVDLVHYSELGGCDVVHNVNAGAANPVAGDTIVEGYASHNSTSAAKLYILALIDPTV